MRHESRFFHVVSIRDVVLLASQDGHVALVEKEQTRLLHRRATRALVHESALGGGTILIIMALLTGPIFIFSTFNPGLTSNRVETATMTVQLDFVAGEKTERHMLYTGFATGYAMTSDAEEAIKKELLTSVTFRRIDSDCVRFPKFSESPWILPSMAKDDVAQILNRTAAANACDATVTMTTSFTRVGPPDVKTVTLNLEAQLTDAQCVQLATVIDDGSGTLQLENIVPRGLHLTPGTEVESLDGQTTNYVGVNMTLDSTPKEVLWRVLPWRTPSRTRIQTFAA